MIYSIAAMADKLKVNILELTRFAGVVLDAANGLSDGLQGVQNVVVPRQAFGNCESAGALFKGQQGAAEDGGDAVQNLVGCAEGDSENLYRAAFSYKATDAGDYFGTGS